MFAPKLARETILSMEGEITGPPRDVPKENGEWIKILCSCKIYGMKKNKLGIRKKRYNIDIYDILSNHALIILLL